MARSIGRLKATRKASIGILSAANGRRENMDPLLKWGKGPDDKGLVKG